MGDIIVDGSIEWLKDRTTGEVLGYKDARGGERFLFGQTLFPRQIPFVMFAGDGGSNGLSFSGTAGQFALSAAVVSNFWNMVASGGYAYLPAGAGGLATGGWYWCKMTNDTTGEIFSEMYSGTGKPPFITNPTPFPNLSAGRITQSTNEISAGSFTLPGGLLGPNGRLSWSIRTAGSNAASIKSFRGRFGSTAFYAAQPTTNPCMEIFGFSCNLGTQSRQCNARSGSVGISSAGATIGTTENTAVDLSVDQTVAFSMQLAANTDAAAIIYSHVSAQYGA
jgi:hypothetical protein